jgi:Uma2 family endonuclease
MASSALAGKLRKRFTPAEYLRMERAAQEKNEYYDGEIFAMSGALEPHNVISVNFVIMLAPLRKRGCQPYGSDMRVGVTKQGPFFYPDVSVVCGPKRLLDGRRDVLLNPVLIVEVLSKSTHRFDRSVKVEEYQRMPSVQAILLVSQDRPRVEVYLRHGDSWKHLIVSGLEKFIEIPSPRCMLPLADIYEGVALLEPQPKAIR